MCNEYDRFGCKLTHAAAMRLLLLIILILRLLHPGNKRRCYDRVVISAFLLRLSFC